MQVQYIGIQEGVADHSYSSSQGSISDVTMAHTSSASSFTSARRLHQTRWISISMLVSHAYIHKTIYIYIYM